MKTAIAALFALGVLAGQASARTVFDDINATAPRSAFTDLADTAPRGAFDNLNESAPRAPFGDLADTAPRSDGVYGTLEKSAP